MADDYTPLDYIPQDQTNDPNAGEQAAQQAYKANPSAYVDPTSAAANDAALSSGGLDPYNPASYANATSGTSPMAVDHGPTIAQLVASGATGGPTDLISRLMGGLGKVNDWANSNKSNPILAAALSGFGSAQKNEQAKQAAAQLQADKIASMDHEAQIARDRIAANSASVSGLRPTKGIIASQLTRIGGAPVFQPNGRMA